MKKILLGFIPLLILFVACFSAPATTTQTAGVDELDATIREASDELNIDVPAGNYIGIINIQSSSAALSEYIIDELIRNAVRDRNFTVVDRQRLDQIRQEHDFQYSGEVDDNLAVDIGRIIGLQTIVTGSVSPLGNRYRITIRALNVQTGAVQAQFNKNIAAGETIVALMQAGGRTQTASAGNTGQTSTPAPGGGTAQTAAPSQTQTPAPVVTRPTANANGTYYFYPRLQVLNFGVYDDTYIEKIVVRGNYFTIYMTTYPNRPTPAGNPWVGSGSSNTILQDLDNPRRTWQIVNQQFGSWNPESQSFITFENVTGTRFTMTNLTGRTGYGDLVFEEIDLSKAEYEP